MNLLFIPLTIGLPAIDESLEKLLTAMGHFQMWPFSMMPFQWQRLSVCAWPYVSVHTNAG